MNKYEREILEAEFRQIGEAVKAWYKLCPTAVALSALLLVLTGCTATESIIREYDAEGNLIRKTYTSESLVKDVTESTKNKTVVAWENGWAAYLSASTSTQEDPTPHVKMWAGKAAKGVISALPNQQNWEGIAATITATREDLRVSASGMEAEGSSATK